jgi:ATP-dependent RNA helicase DDX52/ROK1
MDQMDYEENSSGGSKEEEEGKEEDFEEEEEDAGLQEEEEEESVSRYRKRQRIRVLESDEGAARDEIPDPVMCFEDLERRYPWLPDWLLANLRQAGFERPTAVQAQSWPLLLEGRELLGIAPTGSGKTLAYLVPLLAHVWRELADEQQKAEAGPAQTAPNEVKAPNNASKKKRKGMVLKLKKQTWKRQWKQKQEEEKEAEEEVVVGEATEAAEEEEAEEVEGAATGAGTGTGTGVRAVVVAPTRELAVQIYHVAERFAEGSGVRIAQLTRAERMPRCALLVATPLRLARLAQHSPGEFARVRRLVLDEADKLLALHEALAQQVDEVLAACAASVQQRCLFSATLPPTVEELARGFLRRPVRVLVGARHAAARSVRQRLVFCGREEGKLFALRQLLAEGWRPPGLVFVQSRERALDLKRELQSDGFRVDALSASLPAGQRARLLEAFRTGRVHLLVCTDLLARGMDFRAVNLVVNYDFPTSAALYIHRVGRAGRAGREGLAVTLYTERDLPLVRTVAHIIRNSGTPVDDWLLNATPRLSQKEKRRLATHPPHRKRISSRPRTASQEGGGSSLESN